MKLRKNEPNNGVKRRNRARVTKTQIKAVVGANK